MQTLALWSGPGGPHRDYNAVAELEYDALKMFTDAGIAQVDDPSEAEEGKQQVMLSLEGCEVFQDGLDKVALWRERGVRIGGLVWNWTNTLATPSAINATDGLTEYGISVVHEMERQGIAVDVSHLNVQGFNDVLQYGTKPPMASHSCCYSLRRHHRNLTDDQIKALIEAGGYIGMNFYPEFLTYSVNATTKDIVRHIDHICQLGGEKHVGLGSDFDGITCAPGDVRHPGELGNLVQALRDKGYPEDTVADICGGNFLRYFGRIG